MTTGLRLLFSLSSLIAVGTIAAAHTPVDFLEVLTVEPDNRIEHSVELKSRFDDARVDTMLSGPNFFSIAVGCMDRSVKKNKAYLSWYKIVNAPDQPRREVPVLDMVRGYEKKMLTVESAEYFLCPSQRISTGSPDPIPEGLDHYKAYRVVDAPAVDMEVTISDSSTAGTRTLAKPIYLCVATSEWHHDEFFAASHPNDCFVVYELDPRDHQESISSMDQFGLNQLQANSSCWLCVRAALLKSKTAVEP